MIDDAALARMRTANPVPDLDLISSRDLAAVAEEIARRRSVPVPEGELARLAAPGGWWVRPLVAFAAAALLAIAVIGVVSLATRDEAATTPAATMPTFAAGPTQREWSDVLATTEATALPQIASCGIKPSPGPATQDKPSSGWTGSLSGAFDSRRGLVVYVDSWQDTWAFDVCTNTWSRLSPEGRPGEYPSGGLVYDVDSDVMVAMSREIAVYDPVRNVWSYPDGGTPTGPGAPFGGVWFGARVHDAP